MFTLGALHADRTVLVQGERILAAEARLTILVPPGAVVIDGAGRIVAPGLLDVYAHFTDPEAQGLAMLANGEAFVRGLGSATETALTLRERGQTYVLVASLSSGISLFGSLEIPLQQDALFARTLAAPPPMLSGARGVLNSAGKAHADLRVAAGAMSSWIGRTIYFAAITGSAGSARVSSVAQHLTILP